MRERTDGSGRTHRSFRSRLTAPFVAVLLAILVGAGNILSNPDNDSWFVSRMEFNPTDYLESRHGVKFRANFAPVLFMDKLGATEYLCVAADSIYYPYLTGHQELTGIGVDSSCSPLDFTDRPADSLHPKLITAPVARSYLYFAYVPGFEPKEKSAILVEAHGGVSVLVNLDTLRHLGIDAEVSS